PVGVLTSTPTVANGSAITLTPATTLFLDMPLADGGVPAPPHDQLVVNGAVALGGAALAGSVATTLPSNTNVTVVQASGGVSGKFAEPGLPNTAMIDGRKFTLAYNSQNAVLQLAIFGTQVALTGGTPNPASLGQPIAFTATVSVLPPGTQDPAAGTVNFYN